MNGKRPLLQGEDKKLLLVALFYFKILKSLAMIIKSLTQFKKSLKVGHKVAVTFHLRSKGCDTNTMLNTYEDDERPVREVIECNSTGFTLATYTKGKWEGRRAYYKDFKANNCYIESGKLIIMGHDLDNPNNNEQIKWLTIQIVD